MRNVTGLFGSGLLICGLTLATDSHTFIHYVCVCVCVYVRELILKGNLTLRCSCWVQTPLEALQVNTKPSFEKNNCEFPAEGK